MNEENLIKGIDKLNKTFKMNDDNLVLNNYERQRLFKLAYDMQMKINNLQQKIDKVDKIINNCFTGEEIPIGDDYVYHEYYHYEPLEREEALELLDILRGDE